MLGETAAASTRSGNSRPVKTEDCVSKAEKKEPLADSLEELQQVVAKIR